MAGRIREDDTTPWWATTPWWSKRPGNHVHPVGAFSGHSSRRVAIRGLVVLVVSGGLVAAAVGTAQPRTRYEGSGITSVRQSTDSLLGACGRVFEKRTSPGTAGVVGTVMADGLTPNIPAYGTIVPMTGAFWSPPADPRVRLYTASSQFVPEPSRLLHNMWQGALVVYYTTTAPPGEVRRLGNLAAARPDLDLIVVPWDVGRGDLPSGRRIAFATWGASQTCQHLVEVALEQFRTAHPQAKAPGYGGASAPSLPGATAGRLSAQ